MKLQNGTALSVTRSNCLSEVLVILQTLHHQVSNVVLRTPIARHLILLHLIVACEVRAGDLWRTNCHPIQIGIILTENSNLSFVVFRNGTGTHHAKQERESAGDKSSLVTCGNCPIL